MKRYRSILACILALLVTFVVSCGAPEVAEPPTYSSTQIEQIQNYSSEITALRDRMTSELSTYIQKRQWVEVDNFIHGPLGTMLRTMNYLTRNLLPDDQPAAQKLARETFEYLVQVGKAAEVGDQSQAASNYQKALDDLNAFLKSVPDFTVTEPAA
ncbi:MAG: photosystem II protein PsbQ [Microcoleaceae cyanobacterium]